MTYKLWASFTFAFALVLMVQCADPGGFSEEPTINPGPPKTHRINLVLFSTGWCPACKEEIPDIEALIEGLGEKGERVDVLVYVGEGWQSGQLPTKQMVAEYKERLGVSFEMEPDLFWKNFRSNRYFGKSAPTYVLAAVVENEEGGSLKKSEAGSFSPQSLVDFIEFKLDE